MASRDDDWSAVRNSGENMTSRQDPLQQPSVGVAEVPINPGRILRAIARIGYTPESAICDIVDNSVAANARRAVIKLERQPDMSEARRNSAARYIIADDGDGMDRDSLIEALALGADGQYDSRSLGKYGLGLKSAGLSQGDRIEVVSAPRGGSWGKVVLDLPHVEETGRLECLVMEPNSVDLERANELIPGATHGTVITIEKIHKRNHPSIRKTRAALERNLGITYFYFLQPNGGHLEILLDGDLVEPFDPLFVEEADASGNLDDSTWNGRDVRWLEHQNTVILDAENGVEATIEATQLVHPPAFENPAEIRKKYMIGSGSYGFYIYRNKRLIRMAERFNGLIPTDQDYFAFRGRILIDDSADDAFNIDVKKSEILLSEEAEGALSEAIYEARRLSKSSWKNAAAILRKKANADPNSKAAEALSEVEFPDFLPTDPDDAISENERTKRARKESDRHPLKEEERDQARKEGARVTFVDQLDDNALWERARDASLGTVVRINRSHRFMRMFDERFGDDADVVLLIQALFLSLASAESGTVRNKQDLDDEIIEEVFVTYRNQASAAVYKATADALEKRFA
ncbi:ATP-binding protein [Streptomyces sp. NPDC056937]|uniref:ATP-binding protein n=1 Tax=Streptomyces sp. NPDC056937 TaxID=3345969 RepID=UPI003626D8A1